MDYNVELDYAIFELVTKALMDERKLLAIRFIRFRYDVGLKEAKTICDGVLGWNNRPVFYIKGKRNIKFYISSELIKLKYKE